MQSLVWSIYLLLVFLAIYAVSEDWYGSKLGTTEYNQELKVIQAGVDMAKQSNRRNVSNEFLCVTFIGTSLAAQHIVQQNINASKTHCKWAIVTYTKHSTVCTLPFVQSNSIFLSKFINFKYFTTKSVHSKIGNVSRHSSFSAFV